MTRSSKQKPKELCAKNGCLFPMLEIIKPENSTQKKQTHLQKNSVSRTQCFGQKNQSVAIKVQYQKKPEKSQKQKRCNARLIKLRILHYVYKELSCRFATFLFALER